jgi:hypothetical protein
MKQNCVSELKRQLYEYTPSRASSHVSHHTSRNRMRGMLWRDLSMPANAAQRFTQLSSHQQRLNTVVSRVREAHLRSGQGD